MRIFSDLRGKAQQAQAPSHPNACDPFRRAVSVMFSTSPASGCGRHSNAFRRSSVTRGSLGNRRVENAPCRWDGAHGLVGIYPPPQGADVAIFEDPLRVEYAVHLLSAVG